jgi:hypothetical protein
MAMAEYKAARDNHDGLFEARYRNWIIALVLIVALRLAHRGFLPFVPLENVGPQRR